MGDAANYAVLYQGNGGHNLQITNVTVNGSIGVGGTGHVADSGPSTIAGSLNFAGANAGQYSNNNGSNVGPMSVNYSVSQVQTDLAMLNTLSQTLGAEAGSATSLAINVANGATQVINASSGFLDSYGNLVFNVTSMHFVNGSTLQINGDGVHNVVFDLGIGAQFQGSIVLTGGLTPDQVLWNMYGGNAATMSGGPTLQLNNNHAAQSLAGVFLDPYGTISVTNTTLDGRVFGGDSSDMQIVSDDTITAPASVPEPAILLLLGSAAIGLALLPRWFGLPAKR